VVREDEAPLLTGLLQQIAELVAPESAPDADPLAAMVGIGTSTKASDDPVLARLFPDAYPDDPEAAGEFRRYTETGLRELKQAAALTALATLDQPGTARELTEEQTLAWVGALNDIRLALGTRLGVTEDDPSDTSGYAGDAGDAGVEDDDPLRFLLELYGWLGWLQEQVVACLG
jgi:hypothetical protein